MILRTLQRGIFIAAAGALLGVFGVGNFVRADVYELVGGGEVVGEAVERAGNGDYVVKTVDGVRVTLAKSSVARIVAESPALAEYRQRSRAMADTAEGHRALAKWCLDSGLVAERDVHLARVIELDPQDEDARRSLDYLKLGGRWLSREEAMASRGMAFYDGKFRTEQDVAIRERDKRQGGVEVDWFKNLRLWCDWMRAGKAGRADEGRARLTATADPAATPAVVRLLHDERDADVRDLLLDVLGRLDHPQATETLTALSLSDVGSATRSKALDYLLEGPRRPSIVPYVQALKSKDNKVVNRAGTALGRIGDREAVSPLIDAVTTRHKFEVTTGNGGRTGAAFDPTGQSGGLSMGGGTKIIERELENQQVLRALVKLTEGDGGEDFGFDAAAWRRWFVDMQMHAGGNLRRDE